AATINQAQLTQLSIQYQDPKIFNNTSTTPSSVQHQNFIPYDSQQQHTRATKYSSNQLNGYNVTPTIQQLSAQQPIQLQNFQQQLQQQLQQQALQPQQQTMQSQQLQQKTFLSNKFSTQPSITASNKELPQKPAKKTGNTKRVKALYDFAPTEAGELGFVRGDVISVIDNDVYKDWWRGEIRGKTGIFPETLSEPTPDDIEKEAEVETLIFAQAQKIEILLEKLKRIDLQKKNAMEDEEIQELYSSMLPIRSKLVKVIEKYSQKKDQLISLHSKFIQSTKTYEKLMQESIQKYDYPSSISYSTKVAQNPNYNLISQQIPQDYHLLKQEASVLATFPQASSILYQQQQQSDMYNQSKFYNPQKIQYPLLPSQHLQNQQITYQSLPQEILNQQNLLHVQQNNQFTPQTFNKNSNNIPGQQNVFTQNPKSRNFTQQDHFETNDDKTFTFF
ncbi:9972_t:CDS:10, partial [Entrophospora sp. SA101]